MNRWLLLLLRAAVASIYLYHGLPKALDWAFAAAKFEAMGFPGFLGPLVGIVEVSAAGLLVVGAFHRWANLALVVVIGVAIAGVQLPASVAAGKVVAGLERDALILVAHLVLLGCGSGALSYRSDPGLLSERAARTGRDYRAA